VESLDLAQVSPRLTAVRKALGNPAMLARHTYTSAGDANALFMLGRIFSVRDGNVSMAKSEDLTWQQLADNNVVMIGGPRFFVSLLRGLPSTLSYSLEDEGIRILYPNAARAATDARRLCAGHDSGKSPRPWRRALPVRTDHSCAGALRSQRYPELLQQSATGNSGSGSVAYGSGGTSMNYGSSADAAIPSSDKMPHGGASD
jgi:hypothetical protein